LRAKETLGIFAIAVLSLLLLVGIEQGLWTLANLLQYGPYFIMAAMVGIFVWSFKERFELRTQELPSQYQTTVERLPISRTERVSKWAWSTPIVLLIGAGELLYATISSWETVVGLVCNTQRCGYEPVLTFANAVLVLLFFLALFFLIEAYLQAVNIRNARKVGRQL